MKPSELIREARNVLFERGWTQGALEENDGRVCIEGACMKVTDCRTDLACALNELRCATPKGYSVFFWNDEPGRTFSEVVDLMDKAEKIAEQREASGE